MSWLDLFCIKAMPSVAKAVLRGFIFLFFNAFSSSEFNFLDKIIISALPSVRDITASFSDCGSRVILALYVFSNTASWSSTMGNSVSSTSIVAVSYTHLDVYKRQASIAFIAGETSCAFAINVVAKKAIL